ncbi:MAG: zinc ribbon domain-containing protein [Clostridia bacterium]|nr:zinc ribbon domain-containing protein [Clostridia bacterium]
MSFCVKCGSEIREGFVFCPVCGTKAIIPEVVVRAEQNADNSESVRKATVSRDDLLNYIRVAADMEKGYYRLGELCSNIDLNISVLNRKANEARKEQSTNAPQPPIEPIDYSNDERHIEMARVPDMSGNDLGDALKAMFLPTVWITDEVKKKREEIRKAKERLKNEYESAYKQYLKDKEDFPRKVLAHNNYVQAKINEERAMLQNIQELNQVKADLKKQMSKAKLNMETFYSADIVYSKYRGLIPIVMFCEYLESGRCDSIKECMNKYEEDVKYHNIITKLEDIENAEYATQRALCELAEAVSHGMKKISNTLYDINNQINVATYNMQIQTECQKQMQENLDAIKWYEDVKFIKGYTR